MMTLEERLKALGNVVDDHYGPIALQELGTLPDTEGDDLAVVDLRGPDRSPAPGPRKRRAAVLAVAAAILLVVGAAVVVDRNSDGLVTGAVTSTTTPDTSPSPSVTEPALSSDQSGVFTDGVEVRQELASVIAAGPGLVAVGGTETGSFTFPVQTNNDAAVWTSVDGMTWSRVPHDAAVFSPIRRQTMTDLTAGGPGLVAVGHLSQTDDFQNPGHAAAVWTSVDGTTWSLVPHDEEIFGGPGNQRLNGVTAGGPGLVAVGSNGGGYGRSAAAAVWTSVDGLTWTRVPHDEVAFGGAEMHSVAVGGPGLVAVGSSGVGGDNFDSQGTDPPFVIDGEYFDSQTTEADRNHTTDAVVWTSVDGITWSRVPHDDVVFGGPGNQSMKEVIPFGPGWVAIGADGRDHDSVDAAVWTSIDGVAWLRIPHDEEIFGGPDDQRMTSVTAGGPGLVAVGFDGLCSHGDHDCEDVDAAVWTSIDGVAWLRIPHDDDEFGGAGSQLMSAVTANGQTLVAVGRDGTATWNEEGTVRAAVWTSADGVTWSRVAPDQTDDDAGS